MRSFFFAGAAPRLLSALALASIAAPAAADIVVAFQEGAPTDRFVIRNEGACAVGDATIEIDLSTAQAGVIFDVTGAGAGVSVHQPLLLAEDETGVVVSVSSVTDGDQRLAVEISGLAAGAEIVLTVDIDDLGEAGARDPTRVTGAEISGAIAAHVVDGDRITAPFDDSAAAALPVDPCLS